MSEPKSMSTPDPLYPLLHATLQAAQDLLLAAAKAYAEDLPDDARAWSAMLAAGRVVPALTIALPPEGAKIACGYATERAASPAVSFDGTEGTAGRKSPQAGQIAPGENESPGALASRGPDAR